MARVEARTARTVSVISSEPGARLKVSATDYGMATAEAGTATTKMSAAIEMAAATEMGSPTAAAHVATAATTTHMAAAAPTAAPTSTVSSSGSRHGSTHGERGHGQDPEGPAEKSCLSHLDRHLITPSLHAWRY